MRRRRWACILLAASLFASGWHTAFAYAQPQGGAAGWEAAVTAESKQAEDTQAESRQADSQAVGGQPGTAQEENGRDSGAGDLQEGQPEEGNFIQFLRLCYNYIVYRLSFLPSGPPIYPSLLSLY